MSLNPADYQPSEDPASPDTEMENEETQLHHRNLVDELSEDQLTQLSIQCKNGYEYDAKSREDWENDLDTWISLAKQIRDEKSYPWHNASNVKYPLLSTAAMQFAARSYPSLVPSNGEIVKAIVIGKDASGEKFDRSERVATYMSYQIMHEMDRWEEDMDKLLMMLPIIGMMFKKTWYDKS